MRCSNQNWLGISTSWKGTKETNTHNFCLKNKLTADNYGRITTKTPTKIPSNISIFCSNVKFTNSKL